MADDLSEFRRTNISEVVGAKNTLEATLEALPDAVVLLDAGGRVIDGSGRSKCPRVCGNPRAAWLGGSPTRWFDVSAVTMAIATGAACAGPVDLARTIRVDQGAPFSACAMLVPVPASTQQQGGAVLLLYDVNWSTRRNALGAGGRRVT